MDIILGLFIYLLAGIGITALTWFAVYEQWKIWYSPLIVTIFWPIVVLAMGVVTVAIFASSFYQEFVKWYHDNKTRPKSDS